MPHRLARKPLHSFTVAAVLALFSAPGAFAGFVYTFDVRDHDAGGDDEKHEMAVEGKNLTITVPAGADAGGDLIFRGDRRQLLFLDPGSKTYMLVDEASARDLGERFGGGGPAGYLQDALSQLDPEQRRQLEQYLGPESDGGGGGELRVEASSTRGEHGGYATVRWDAYRGGEKLMELWVTDWSNLEGGAEVRPTFEDFAGFWGELVDAGMPSDDFEMIEAMVRVKGFPVSTHLLGARQQVSLSWALGQTEGKTLLSDEFEPAGFTRQSVPGGD
ncbi:MAG: hypothetical protein AAGF23_16730 [Acidobacteriota bacterium]